MKYMNLHIQTAQQTTRKIKAKNLYWNSLKSNCWKPDQKKKNEFWKLQERSKLSLTEVPQWYKQLLKKKKSWRPTGSEMTHLKCWKKTNAKQKFYIKQNYPSKASGMSWLTPVSLFAWGCGHRTNKVIYEWGFGTGISSNLWSKP